MARVVVSFLGSVAGAVLGELPFGDALVEAATRVQQTFEAAEKDDFLANMVMQRALSQIEVVQVLVEQQQSGGNSLSPSSAYQRFVDAIAALLKLGQKWMSKSKMRKLWTSRKYESSFNNSFVALNGSIADLTLLLSSRLLAGQEQQNRMLASMAMARQGRDLFVRSLSSDEMDSVPPPESESLDSQVEICRRRLAGLEQQQQQQQQGQQQRRRQGQLPQQPRRPPPATTALSPEQEALRSPHFHGVAPTTPAAAAAAAAAPPPLPLPRAALAATVDEAAYLKTHVIGNAAVFNKLAERGGIVVDRSSGRVVEFRVRINGKHLLNEGEKIDLRFDLARLSELTGLRKLGLDELPYVTGDIAALGNLRCLEKLGLDSTDVTGDIASLHTMTNLMGFALYQTRVWGDIKSLQHLPRLSGFTLYATRVCGDIGSLSGLPRLIHFGLHFTDVTGDISRLPRTLIQFWLEGTKVTGSLGSLRHLTDLETFSLASATRVGGDITHLRDLRHLRECHLRGTAAFGDREEFCEYRRRSGLASCSVDI